jgi:hypothetical protein
MKSSNFEIALRTFSKQRPFRPYTIEFTSGSRVVVDHPEALRPYDTLLVYRSAAGTYVLFECESVVRLIAGRETT